MSIGFYFGISHETNFSFNGYYASTFSHATIALRYLEIDQLVFLEPIFCVIEEFHKISVAPMTNISYIQ